MRWATDQTPRKWPIVALAVAATTLAVGLSACDESGGPAPKADRAEATDPSVSHSTRSTSTAGRPGAATDVQVDAGPPESGSGAPDPSGRSGDGPGGPSAESPASPDLVEQTRERIRGDRLADGLDVENGSDESEAAAVVDELYDRLAVGKPAPVCALISDRTKREMARRTGGNTAPQTICLQTFGAAYETADTSNVRRTLAAEIRDVEIDGGEGVVTVAFGSKLRDVPVTEENGRWKIATEGGA